jgi:adenylyltransferase/sulfurtransferase
MTTAAIDLDLSRYHRQMLLPGFGEEGQRRLLASKALILGCGALGTVIANTLARAGVGHLVIVDRDFIEITNLQRQVLFDEDDVKNAIPKAVAAKNKIATINSQVQVEAIVDDINHSNIERFAQGCDILVDGVDNFETRFLANDVAVKHGLPYIYGGAVGTVGMSYAILPHREPGPVAPDSEPGRHGPARYAWESLAGGSRATPCLRCIFEQAPPPGMNPTCDTAGVMGPIVSIIASYQAGEAIKVLSGNYERVCPTMLHLDLWSNTVKQLKVARAYDVGDCVCCKHRQFEHLAGKFGSSTTTLCGRNAVQLTHKQGDGGKLDFDGIAARLRSHGPVNQSKFMLRATLTGERTEEGEAFELTLFTDGRAIVKGTKKADVARTIYAKYVGS